MKFSSISQARLNTCHPDLRLIFSTVIQVTDVDFGIAEGNRSIQRQQQLFHEGKSKVDGINTIGKHNLNPSKALDILPTYSGDPAKREKAIEWSCVYLAGLILYVARKLFEEGKVSHRLRWGGNWDQDGEIITDQSFNDLVHYELI